MEPKKIITAILMSFILIAPSHAQRIWEVRKGTVRLQGNLGGGYMFKQKTVSAYLNGELELFLEDRYAMMGGICYSFVTIKKDQTGVKANHAIFFGSNYHFLKPKRFDPYIGLTPGIGIVQASYREGEEIKTTPISVAPLLSVQIGCNYYFTSFLHFFAKGQIVTGQMFSTLPAPQRLDELKFMGGLGWNFRVWKPKSKDVWGKS